MQSLGPAGVGEAFFHKWGFSLGWQGIIPSKAEKMARKACQMITQKLMNLHDVFEKVEPDEIVKCLEPVLHRSVERVLTEARPPPHASAARATARRSRLTDALRARQVALTHAPSVWISLSFETREELVGTVCEASPKYVAAMIADMKEHIEDVLDLEDCLVEKLTEDKRLINEIFMRCTARCALGFAAPKHTRAGPRPSEAPRHRRQRRRRPRLCRCGDSEFRFIERSGLYFGLLLGLFQAGIWFVLNDLKESNFTPDLPLWWFLPLAGAMCGYATNWIAMWLIFKPIEPTVYCGCVTLHGSFLKRQNEVSEEFATISAARLLTAQNCWERIIFGPRSHHLEQIVARQARVHAPPRAYGALARATIPLAL